GPSCQLRLPLRAARWQRIPISLPVISQAFPWASPPRIPADLYLAPHGPPLHLIPPRRHPKTLAAAHLPPPSRRTLAPPWTGRPATPGPRPTSAAAPPRCPVSTRASCPRPLACSAGILT